jgi:hypothetical protein
MYDAAAATPTLPRNLLRDKVMIRFPLHLGCWPAELAAGNRVSIGDLGGGYNFGFWRRKAWNSRLRIAVNGVEPNYRGFLDGCYAGLNYSPVVSFEIRLVDIAPDSSDLTVEV